MKRFAVVAFILVGLALGGFSEVATAQTHDVADKAYIVNTGQTVLETIACNTGTSPCTIGGTSTTVLSKNVNRHECLLQNVGTTIFYCLKGTGTASTTNFLFALKAGTAANDGTGGSYSCNQGAVVWSGPIVCVGSAGGGSLAVSGD